MPPQPHSIQMSNQVPDHAQRLQALDPNASFIVQAPAGSGKTELLIQRFLVLLARVKFPEEIVAITFTRKAAAEMRHRIIRVLQRAAGQAPTVPHEKHTWDLARLALERNDRRAWNLLDNPLRLRIQTIDSLCSLLVRRMPWVSRMGVLLRPEEDARHLYQKAAHRTLEFLYSVQARPNVVQAIAVLLGHLDNDMRRVEQLLGAMLGSRDQWIRHVDGMEHEPAKTRAALESALTHIVECTLERMVAEFPQDHTEDVVELARFAAENLRNEGSESVIGACADLRGLPGSSAADLPCWLGIAELFLTGTGKRRSRYSVREGFPAGERDAKERIQGIHLAEETITQLKELRQLPPSSYEESQWEVLAALMHLLPAAVAQLRKVFQENGSVDFTEIGIAAQQAAKAHMQSGTQGGILDIATRHLLVDEFQDTSQSQYELFERLIHDWKEDGRTLFLVGDPMQSIYGFREAEVSLFSRTRTSGIGPIRPRSLVLETNFRSSTEIVSWVNEALGAAFPEVEDTVTGSVVYSPSTAFRTDLKQSKVAIHPFFYNDLDGQAEKVVQIIAETQSRQPDATIAVLVQARRHLLQIISVLRERGITFRSVDIDPLGERPVVRDLIALTQALLHPGNRIAWLSILRAPWCGLQLADLQRLVGNDLKTPVMDLLARHATRMSTDGRQRVERILPTLQDAYALTGRLPVRRWVEGVWLALGGPACLEKSAHLNNAMAYLDLLEESVEGVDLRDERKFMEDVERLFAPSDLEAGAELQLLTTHKAKGLEFDTVILPGLGYRTRGDAQRLLMWREYNDGDQPHLLLAPIRETGGKEALAYNYLYNVERKRRDHEGTRLLYVAATRARKELHLIGHISQNAEDPELKPPDPRTPLSKIWKVAEPEFSEAWENHPQEENTEDVHEQSGVGVPLLRLSTQWKPVDLRDELIWKAKKDRSEDEKEDREPVFKWVGDLQRRVGIVIHRMLQGMRFPDRVGFSENVLRNALAHEGLDGDNLEEALIQVKQILKSVVEDRRGRWVLSKHEEDAWEYTLTAVTGAGVRRFILDRTFVEDGRRWIVDYKTSTHLGSDVDDFLDQEQERYQAKMELYARAMRAIDSKRPIFLGLYFPALKGWRQWEYIDSKSDDRS